ncbi:hypothetical protein Aduo_006968 [Ancylostoma duodenale]
MPVVKTTTSKTIRINEDIAHIIVKHLRQFEGTKESQWIFPSLERHWTNVKGVSRTFYTAVRRYLAQTSRVTIALVLDGTSVSLHSDDSRHDNGSIAQTFFVEETAARAYIRVVAGLVTRPVVLELEDFYGHTLRGDNKVIRSLTCFQNIKIINVYRECDCTACSALVQHAGPDVPIVEWGPLYPHESFDKSYDSDTSVTVDSDDEDRFFGKPFSLF